MEKKRGELLFSSVNNTVHAQLLQFKVRIGFSSARFSCAEYNTHVYSAITATRVLYKRINEKSPAK